MRKFSVNLSTNNKLKKKFRVADPLGFLLIPITIAVIALVILIAKSFGDLSLFERHHDVLGQRCPIDRPYLYIPSLINCALVGPSIYEFGCLTPTFCVPECPNYQYSFRFGIPIAEIIVLKGQIENKKYLIDRIPLMQLQYPKSKHWKEMVPHKGVCHFKMVHDQKFKVFDPYFKYLSHIPLKITIEQLESAQAWYRRFRKVRALHLFIAEKLVENNISLTLYLFIGCVLSMFWVSMKLMSPVFMLNFEIFATFFIFIGLLMICVSNGQKATIYHPGNVLTNTIESKIKMHYTWSVLGSIVAIALALYCIVLVTDNLSIKATKKLMPFIVGAIKKHRYAYIGLFFVMLVEIAIIACGVRLIAYFLTDSDKGYASHFVKLVLEIPFYISTHGEDVRAADYAGFRSYLIKNILGRRCPNNIDTTVLNRYEECIFVSLIIKKRAKFFIFASFIIIIWILIVIENLIFTWTAKLFCHNYWHVEEFELSSLIKKRKAGYLIANLGTIMTGSFLILLTKPLFLFQFMTPTNFITRRLFLKDINKTPLIVTAFHGTGYFSAIARSRDINSVAVDGVIYSAKGIEISMLLSKFIVSSVTAMYCILDLKTQIDIDAATYIAFLVIFMGTFRISQTCLQVFEISLKSLLLCVHEDTLQNTGTPVSPYHMPKKLINIVSVHKSKEFK